ncbi:metal-dependent hydrolase [Legionella jordanis]|uniref:Integral membrane protein n=1 Tax=Legionella jordanis TaxID=456 RepID=A0A0W0V9I5_9GAMM|nr:metal-dependent hydrolase [Legionella jordanis]KTD16803.1 integral membrane protein [Legionella jordanis]RMX03672.1 metal-dependent hydrolase [Legionella jordanis]RMX22267.1 metal-dependent hydrolase [Legionella jordanis]VEH11730.1 membrane-bound metal-dependent hydrolase [Legionella jordanis]HAT8712958.1 metal-dependent hydrolase [Legionella jordanis]
MDPITHGALGAACARGVLAKGNTGIVLIAGALAGMAADLDVFIRSAGHPLLFFLYHRHFTHSLMFIPVGAFLIGLCLLLLLGRREPWKLVFAACLIGYSTHGLLDACTSYGTLLYWPFSYTRISWDLISIIDPFFTFPLILGVVWTIVHGKRIGVFVGLSIAMTFLLFNSLQHLRSLRAAELFVQQNHLGLHHLRVMPKLMSSLNWRGIGRSERDFFAMDVSTPLLKRTTIQLKTHYPLMQAQYIPDYLRRSPTLMEDLGIFSWFSDYYSILVNKQPLVLADGRFLMDDRVNQALWSFAFLPNKTYAEEIRFLRIGREQ